MGQTLAERFWSKVDRAGPGECWGWSASVDDWGYGRIGIGHPHWDRGHRVSWRLHFGEIPDGLCVCHHCDNPPCCNPAHLYLGSPADNARDAVSRGRMFVPRGELAPKAKLKLADVQQIRDRWAAGEGVVALARAFDVHRTTIYRLIRGESWASVS